MNYRLALIDIFGNTTLIFDLRTSDEINTYYAAEYFYTIENTPILDTIHFSKSREIIRLC